MVNKDFIQKASLAVDIVKKWSLLAGAHASTLKQKLAFQHGLGHLEVHLVACVLDKRNRTYDKVEDAARGMMEDFEKQTLTSIPCPPEWQANQPAPASSASSKLAPPTFRKYSDAGILTNQIEVMASLGFKVGVRVQRGSEIGVIASLKNDEVALTMENEDGSATQAFVGCSSFLGGEWKPRAEVKPRVEIQWLPDAPPSCSEWAWVVLRAQIMVAMNEQCKALKGWESLKMFTNPKAVEVDKAWAAKKLQLPCFTTKVMLVDPAETSPDQLIIGSFDSFMVVIAGANKPGKGNGDGFQNPFWALQKATEVTEANMEAGGRGLYTLFDHSGLELVTILWVKLIAMS